MEKLKRYSLTEIVCYKWTDPKMFCLSSDVAALEARVEELESALAASRGKLQEAEKALQVLHDECCTYGPKENRKTLNVGPMLEPSEKAVLNARAAPAEIRKE